VSLKVRRCIWSTLKLCIRKWSHRNSIRAKRQFTLSGPRLHCNVLAQPFLVAHIVKLNKNHTIRLEEEEFVYIFDGIIYYFCTIRDCMIDDGAWRRINYSWTAHFSKESSIAFFLHNNNGKFWSEHKSMWKTIWICKKTNWYPGMIFGNVSIICGNSCSATTANCPSETPSR